MATGLITKRSVDRLTPTDKPIFLWDTEVKGFGVKVLASGVRTYVLQYRMGGRKAAVRRYSIGKHGPWTPDKARSEAKRLLYLVGTGNDPAAKHAYIPSQQILFSQYATQFIDDVIVPRWPGGQDLACGILRRNIVPALGAKELQAIDRVDITKVMDSLAKTPGTRRNAFAVLRRLFSWAVSRGDLDRSPMSGMEVPNAPKSRERVLTNEEMREIWNAAQKLGYPFGPFIQLLILTGQRRDEVAGMSWNEVHRNLAVWSIPAERTKNNLVHDVPLSKLALRVFDRINIKNASSKFCEWPKHGLIFSTKPNRYISGYSKSKRRIDDIIRETRISDCGVELVMPPWRYHDLRRTVATELQKLDIRFEVTEAVLNHVSGARSGIAGVYQRHDWKAEKREALCKWGTLVKRLIVNEDGNTS